MRLLSTTDGSGIVTWIDPDQIRAIWYDGDTDEVLTIGGPSWSGVADLAAAEVIIGPLTGGPDWLKDAAAPTWIRLSEFDSWTYEPTVPRLRLWISGAPPIYLGAPATETDALEAIRATLISEA